MAFNTLVDYQGEMGDGLGLEAPAMGVEGVLGQLADEEKIDLVNLYFVAAHGESLLGNLCGRVIQLMDVRRFGLSWISSRERSSRYDQ